MIRSKLFIFFVFITVQSYCQTIQLSENAQISVVVADPGSLELYEAFGHPAIRIKDPVINMDLAYNYGIFDFNQPHFYLNFARGFLNYKVEAWPYHAFEASYIYENRSLKEYVLNLSGSQKQDIFDFLDNNVKPENQHYFYDYFYDNCSTRIWEVFEKVLGKDLHFNENYTATGHSFRTLVDSLTVNMPWGDFGIDLCLGLPMDKKLTPYEYMFLPEFLGRSIAHSSITIKGVEHPFVKESKAVFQSTPENIETGLFTPNFIFWSVFVLIALLTITGFLKNKKMVILDVAFFGITGLIGVFLVLLWAATDHNAAANNLNIIWANPIYLVGVFYLLSKNKPLWLKKFFLVIGIMLILFLISWPVNPQGINVAVIPIALALALRSFVIYFRQRNVQVNT